MIPTTVTAEMAVESFLTAGVLLELGPVGELALPQAASKNVRRRRQR
jgi:hypothetical protein